MKKKMLSLLMIMAIAISGLAGCSSKEEQSSGDKLELEKKNINMGRYMEKDVELPELGEQEKIFKILRNSEKQFEVFTMSNKSGEYLCYRYNDTLKWEKSKPEWLNQKEIAANGYVNDIYSSKDGTYYVVLQNYTDSDGKSYVFKSSEDGTSVQAIDIPYLKEVENVIEDIKYYPMINNIAELENGDLVFDDNWSSKELNIYSSKDKKITKIPVGQSQYSNTQQFMASGNNVITSDTDGNILVYNAEKKMTDKKLKYDGKSSRRGYAVTEDGTLIMGDSAGIHRLTKDGSLWETMVDGNLNSMGMPSQDFISIFVVAGEPEEYFAIYQDSDRGYQLKHYVFDQSVSSVPEKDITVYSLEENPTIRQAISIFQSKNTDIRVNYVVAMDDEIQGNVSDYIRALNTELLSGNGADILVLDGLPISSFIEKGVLADLSDVINPLESSGAIMTNILSGYREENKIFQVPVRYGVPILFGKEEALKSSDNLTDIIEYIKKNPNQQYTYKEPYAKLLKDYLALSLEELIQGNKLQEEQLKSFLENMKILADNIKATELNEYGEDGTNRGILSGGEALFRIGITDGDKYATALETIDQVMDTMIPAVVVKDKQLSYGSYGERFLPRGLVGLNSTSKEADIAKEFIQSLFAEEVQNSNLYDGFPVNSASIVKWFAEDNQDIMVGYGGDDGELSASWPSKEERDGYLKVVLEVKHPIQSNEILYNMIVDNALPYLKGDQDINQAVTAVKSKVNTYLAE